MASSIPGLGKVLRRPPFQGRPEKPLTNPGTKVVPRDGHREVEQGFCYIVGGVLSHTLPNGIDEVSEYPCPRRSLVADPQLARQPAFKQQLVMAW